MRKLLSFLALLLVAFALPWQAKAGIDYATSTQWDGGVSIKGTGFNNLSWNSAINMTTTKSGNIYTSVLVVTPSATSAEFKFCFTNNQAWFFGPSDTGNLTLGTTYTIPGDNDGNNINFTDLSTSKTYTITMTADTSNSSFSFVMVQNPDYFGVIGAYSNWKWYDSQKSNTPTNNVVTFVFDSWDGGEFKIGRSGVSTGDNPAKWFTTATDNTVVEVTADDWHDINNPSSYANMKLASEATGNKVTISIATDKGDDKVSFSYTYEVPASPDYYLWHSTGNWSCNSTNDKLTDNGDGTYSIEYTFSSGDLYFTFNTVKDITNDNWNTAWRPDGSNTITLTENGTYDAGGTGGVWKITAAGTYTFTIDPANTQVTVSGFTNETYVYTIDSVKIGTDTASSGSSATKTFTGITGASFPIKVTYVRKTYVEGELTNTEFNLTRYLYYNGTLPASDATVALTSAATETNSTLPSTVTDATVSVSARFEGNTLKGSLILSDVTSSFTRTPLYLYKNDDGWKYSSPIQLTQTSETAYQYTGLVLKEGNLIVISKNGSVSDWNGLIANSGMYSTNNGDQQATLNAAGVYTTTAVAEATTGTWKIVSSGTYTLTFDTSSMALTLTRTGDLPIIAYLPYSADDFVDEDGNPVKHYFIVGTRTGNFKLLPEWELEAVNATTLQLKNRPMHPGYLGVAVVDNYVDYANHRYTYYGVNSSCLITSTNHSSALVNKGAGQGYTGTQNTSLNDSSKSLTITDSDNTKPTKSEEELERPHFAKTITVTLTDGAPSNINFTWGTAAEWLAQQTFTLLGSHYYNKDIYENSSHRTTQQNRGYQTSIDKEGWQEGYVQHDADGNYYYDAEGELLYLTVFTKDWLEDHPVYFSTKFGDETFDYTSDNLTFVNANSINPDDDDYYAFYFNSTSTSTGGGNGKKHTEWVAQTWKWGENTTVESAKDYGSGPWAPNGGWTPYVMSNVWMSGSFKVWTGWGGSHKDPFQTAAGDAKNAAYWYKSNGGPASAGSVSFSNIMGPNGAIDIFQTRGDSGSGNNYMTTNNGADQIFCERVILWYNPDQGFANAWIEFVTGTATPAIKAYRVNHPTSAGNDGKLRYTWSLLNTSAGTDLYIKKYEVRCFRDDADGKEDLGIVKTETFSGDKLVTAPNFNTTNASSLSFSDTNGYSTGTYHYEITVYYEDNSGNDKGKRTIPSNQVPLIGPYAPVPTATQLVKLTGSGITTFVPSPATGSTYYLTYSTTNPKKNLVEETSVGEIVVTELENNDLTKYETVMSDASKHLWTTDYIVRGLDYAKFRTYITGIRNSYPDLITAPRVIPSITVQDNNIGAGSQAAGKVYTIGDNQYHGAIVKRSGNVGAPDMQVDLTYYVTAEQVEAGRRHIVSNAAPAAPTLPQARVTGGKFQLDVEDVEDSSLNEAKGLTLSVYGVDGVTVYHKKDKGAYHLKYVADIDLNVDFGDATSTNAKATVNVQGHNPNVLGSGIDRVWDVTKDEASGRWKGTATVTFVHPASSFFPVFEDKATKFNSTSAGYGYSDSGHSATQTPNHKTRSLSNVKAEMVQTDWKPDGTKDPDGKDHNASNWALKFTSMTINDPVSSVDNPTDSFDYIYGSDGSDGKLEARYYMLEVGGTLYPYLFENFSDISDKFVTTNIADNDKSNISVKVTPIYIFRVAEDGAKGIQAKDVEVKSEVVGTLSDPVYEWPESEATEWFKNSYETAPDKLISTSNYVAYPGTPFETTIGGGDTVTYLGSIVADDADAEVEYYNLQGIRVHNPEAGRVYIRRQGANVSKVVL